MVNQLKAFQFPRVSLPGQRAETNENQRHRETWQRPVSLETLKMTKPKKLTETFKTLFLSSY